MNSSDMTNAIVAIATGVSVFVFTFAIQRYFRKEDKKEAKEAERADRIVSAIEKLNTSMTVTVQKVDAHENILEVHTNEIKRNSGSIAKIKGHLNLD